MLDARFLMFVLKRIPKTKYQNPNPSSPYFNFDKISLAADFS
jgi:hypothetical protein